MAPSPVSPVRMRVMSTKSLMKIFPSPISPVRAALMMAADTFDTRSSLTTISSLILGGDRRCTRRLDSFRHGLFVDRSPDFRDRDARDPSFAECRLHFVEFVMPDNRFDLLQPHNPPSCEPVTSICWCHSSEVEGTRPALRTDRLSLRWVWPFPYGCFSSRSSPENSGRWAKGRWLSNSRVDAGPRVPAGAGGSCQSTPKAFSVGRRKSCKLDAKTVHSILRGVKIGPPKRSVCQELGKNVKS